MELVVKNTPANAGDERDTGSIPGLGRSLREGNSNPLQYCCLGMLCHVQLFATPWTAACQAPLSSTTSWSLLKFMSVDLSQWCYVTISSSAVTFFCLQSFPASDSSKSWLFTSSGQSIESSASASVPPMNIQRWFPLGLTDYIFKQTSVCMWK